MSRYLLEIPHDSDKVACNRAIRVLLESGSHFLTHADWGCADGDHRALLVVDVENREEARSILPPAFRAGARVVRLIRFEIDPTDGKIVPQAG